MDIVTYAALRKLINNAQAVASDRVYFTTTYDEATDTTTFNGTLEELQAAFDSGKKVYIDGSEFELAGNEGSEDVLTAIEIFMQDGLLLLSAKITADSVITILSTDFLLQTGNLTKEITAEATDEDVPTAKAVYDYVANASNASDNGFTVIDVSGELDIDGDIYPDEATEAKIAEVIASVSPAAIRYGGLLFYYVGADVFVTSIHYPEGHSNQKFTYKKDQHLLALSPFLN